ncbi:lambda exonuclease family protein [Achromobacter sp. 2789STDY5608628]|uniref:lambda exonuclease family protein n=1 Tax=Achromobacter sp. 2789STDY5608628 TaxID=1806493 RepID=UPI0006C61CCB|nr:lambda exonuclease family protein [Achromobacter sp. 2789STDY5608628]CUJ54510.1 putative phage-type endonuclease [Achromobacter sp. 2789STDY5608628]
MDLIFHKDPQGSPEWLEARRGVITGSRFKDARSKLKGGAPSKDCTKYGMDVARERAGGRAPEVFASAAMRTGTEQEPFARAAYEAKTGNFVEEAGFITTEDGRFGVSVDGLVDDDGIIEIKTMVSSDTLFTAVVDGDVSAYIDQCNGAMWMLGRKWVDLVLWAPDLEPIGRHLTIIRIERDDDAIEDLESDLLAFERMVTKYENLLKKEAA